LKYPSGQEATQEFWLICKKFAAQVGQSSLDPLLHEPQAVLHERHWPLELNVPAGQVATHCPWLMKLPEEHCVHDFPSVHLSQLPEQAEHLPSLKYFPVTHPGSQVLSLRR
jgi:hypothetical protein